jgi:hypothetical protein
MFKVYGFLNNGTRIQGTLFPTLDVKHLFPTMNVSHLKVLKNEHLSIFILLLSLVVASISVSLIQFTNRQNDTFKKLTSPAFLR